MNNRRPCQFFLRGSCRFGNNCRDYHPNGSMFEQGIGGNNGSGVSITTSGFGTSGGQFNPFSGSSVKPSNEMGNGFASMGGTGNGVGPFGKFGGPFGGAESGPFGGVGGSFGGVSSNPFGGGSTSVSLAGTTFGSSPFGSVSNPFGSGSGSSPFVTGGGGSALGSSPFGSASNPFGSGSGSGTVLGSASTLISSSSGGGGKPAKSDNPVLQTLELIGVVVNSGVWPFGRIGLLNQSQDFSQAQPQIFLSLDLSIEEYRWKFYQSDPGNWNNLHLETLRLLNQQYNAFIEQGKIQSKLPASHQLYSLDFSLYSKIGNWYLPNLGKDYVNKHVNSSSTIGSISNPFGGSTIGFGQGSGTGTGTETSEFGQGASVGSLGFGQGTGNISSGPFGTIKGTSSVNFGASNNTLNHPFGGASMVNSGFGLTNTSTEQSFNVNNSTDTNQVFSSGNNVFGSQTNSNNNSSNMSNNCNIAFGSTTSQLSLSLDGNSAKYSYNNPDVNDDNNAFNSQNFESWELDAFKNSVFEENKIPEKIPPKYLRMYI